MVATFAQIAVNVVRRRDGGNNELPDILKRWFGPLAGQPGTAHRVRCEAVDDGYRLSPLAVLSLEPWRSYAREEIPPLFGLQFSEAVWNTGFVSASSNLFLLTTLEKELLDAKFQYRDHFLAPDVFQWQSQNRHTQDGKVGQDLKNHVERGLSVHLFVRPEKKTPRGQGAPFVYCGPVTFQGSEGEKPITFQWKLSESVPKHLRKRLGVPPPNPS
jgi:hypothetical protein